MHKKILLSFILLFNIFFTYQCFAEADFDGYIVTLKEAETVSLFSYEISEVYENIQPVVEDKKIYKVNSEEELNQLIEAGLVEYAEPDHIVTLFGSLFTPDDYYYKKNTTTYQYGAIMTKFDAVWDMGIFGNDIVVGVVDSGIYAHDELKDNLLPGYNFTVTSSECNNGSKCTNPECEHFNYNDTYMHGTFCAGIMASAANSSYLIGASPAVKVVPLRSFIEKSTSVSNIVSAIYAAVDVYDCDVINMSFGLSSNNTTLTKAIAHAKENNVLMIAAAGNEGKSISSVYPGSYSGVVCVGSVNSAGEKSDFSNYGSCVDIAAPGTGIYSCTLTDSIGKSSGTSFATPYVTSAAALCKMVKPDITNDEFENLLKSTATPFKNDFSYNLGSGILNAENLILKLLEKTNIYYSPINRFNDQTFRMIVNMTDDEMNFYDIWKGKNTISHLNVSMPPYAIYKSDFAEDGNSINYIWETSTLRPINKSKYVAE